LLDAAVPQHFLDMVQRPARLEQSAGAFMPQIVKVKVDRLQRGA